MAITIETDLKEVLGEIKQQLKEIQGDITDIKVSQARMEGELGTIKAEVSIIQDDLKDLKGSQRSQIWVLILAVVGAIIKFGFFPNS